MTHSLTLLEEGYVTGIITALKTEDPIRYCESTELRARVEEILKAEGWQEEIIKYWLDWLNGFIEE